MSKFLNRTFVIILSQSIAVVFLLIGWRIAVDKKPTPLEPVTVSFDGKRQVVDGLITRIGATSEHVEIEWKI